MKQLRTYAIILISLALIFTVPACKKKVDNKRITFWRHDKIPYGTFVAYDWLKHAFPDAVIKTENKSPNTYFKNHTTDTYIVGKKLRVFIGAAVVPTKVEWMNMLADISYGTDYFISTRDVAEIMKDSLGVDWSMMDSRFSLLIDSLKTTIEDPVNYTFDTYSYPGRNGSNSINSIDSMYTTILGWDTDTMANFVKFHYKNGGNLYLHTAPMALTNYFLLHKNNHEYYEKVFSSIAGDKTEVIWDDYFRHHRAGMEKEFSSLQVVWKNPELRWALILVLIIFGCIYLFETKRKEAPLPQPGPQRNSSLDFMETVAALYYQQKDNKNLGEKMLYQFSEYVQRKYFLRLQFGDASFVAALAGKSGTPSNEIESLLYRMRMIRDYPQVSDELLIETHQSLHAFYKNEKNG